MLLSTPAFFVFFLAVWLLYWALRRLPQLRLMILVAANIFFLAKFGGLYLGLIVAASVDFLIGRALGRETLTNITSRRLLLAVSLVVNVGLLVATKLVGFSFSDQYGWLLTLSLSFYCFQSLTYTIDLYRREDGAEPTQNYLAYLAAALFFPTLIAGPILRLPDFLRQLARPTALSNDLAGRALLLIAIGLVKKLLIADYLRDNLVVRVFDTPSLYSGLEVLAAVYGYALQLFYDFSGYTDIALGVGLLLGLKLPENFNRPYLAVDLMDFWRRWHISFSTWLRDYIQEPLKSVLPFNPRKQPLAAYTTAVILTFLIGGLWHGIAWTFVVWGALHGVALALVRVWKNSRKGKKTTRLGTVLATLLTFHFVCFSWIFFNASSLTNAAEMLGRIGSLSFSHDNLTWPIIGVLLLAAVAHCLPLRWLDWGVQTTARAPFWLQGAALAGVVVLIQSLAGQGSAGFIYGSF